MRINELEKTLNISRANIRFYEKEGLINPSRKENGYREYDENDVAILKKIIIYRKLGIPIQDIREIFDGTVVLNEAAGKSIGLMENEISSLNVSIELCEEICEKQIDNKDFDEEYYWNEINTREIKGEEFFDFAGVDISGFDNKKRIKIITIICFVMIFTGILYSGICGKSYFHNNEYYDLKLPEINTYCPIDTIKTDTKNKIMYICYDDATCANAYDFDGNFLWAISIPRDEYSKGVTYFYLDNDKLIIERDADVYIYNASTGDFIEKTYIEKLGIQSWRDTYDIYHSDDLKKVNDLGINFNWYNVFKTDENGNLTDYIVKKPDWYILTNDNWGYGISLIGAIGIFLISVFGALKGLKKIPVNEKKVGKPARATTGYLKILFSFLVAFSIVDIFLALFNIANIAIAIFPVAFIFMLSLIVVDLLIKRFNDDEKRMCGIWRNYCVFTFFVTILCVIIAMFLINL